MKEIREWLEKGQPYAAGVALYETHGRSRVVLKSLQYGETDFTRATLRKELEKILAAGVTAPVTENVTAKPIRAVDTSAERVPETPNCVQAATVPARRDWYAQRSHVHAQLELVATDAERCQMAADILATSEKITASYQASPEAPAAGPLDEEPDLSSEGAIRRQLACLRPQRTKLQKHAHRAGDLARVIQKIKLLEAELKRDGDKPQLHPRN